MFPENDAPDEWKEKREDVRVLLIGDKDVGKSSLWWTYLEGECPDSEKLTRLTKERVNCQELLYGDVTYSIYLAEYEPSEATENLPLSERVTDVDVVVALFSIIDPRTFQNVKYKWCGQARDQNEDLPLVLVGNKLDLREEAAAIPGLAPVSTEEGEEVVQEMNANGYAEISVKEKAGLKQLLRVIVDGILDARNKKFERERLKDESRKTNCLIM